MGDTTNSAWETTFMLPHLGAYMPGTVSDADADDLVRALRGVARSGDPLVHGKLYLTLLTLVEVVKHGSFEVQLESSTPSEEPKTLAGHTMC